MSMPVLVHFSRIRLRAGGRHDSLGSLHHETFQLRSIPSPDLARTASHELFPNVVRICRTRVGIGWTGAYGRRWRCEFHVFTEKGGRDRDSGTANVRQEMSARRRQRKRETTVVREATADDTSLTSSAENHADQPAHILRYLYLIKLIERDQRCRNSPMA